MKTSVHAGEWLGPESLRNALDALRPDRIDHGIAAAQDPHLLERLAEEAVPLFVAPTGNVATGAVTSLAAHPLPRLIEAGVAVALSASPPLAALGGRQPEGSAPASPLAMASSALLTEGHVRRRRVTLRPVDVENSSGSSAERATATPASISRGSGCAASDVTAPVATLPVGATKSGTASSASRSSRCGSCAAAMPWSIRSGRSASSALRSDSGPSHSPACTDVFNPTARARA